jgi:o-succinylbenzoate synthase
MLVEVEERLTIARAEVEELRLALLRPLVTSRGGITTRRGFLLHLVSDEGTEGVGEASPAYWAGGESIEKTAVGLRAIVALAATRPRAASLRRALLDRGGGVRPSAAACALDTALLDLAARACGVAVTSLLGGGPTTPLRVGALLPGEGPDALADEARAAVSGGFRTLKIKVGRAAIAEDVQRVEAVREHAGAGIALRLDANRAWALREAQRALAAFEPFGIEFVEEPLRVAEPRALAALCSSTRVPVAVDESVADITELRRFTQAGAAPVIVLKAARLGGPSRVLELAQAARVEALRVVVTDSIETTVGMSAAVHTAAALPAPPLTLGLGGSWFLDVPAFPVPLLQAAGPGLDVRALAETHATDDA